MTGGAQASPRLLGAGLIVVAASCFGTLGPLARFAAEGGVGSLSLVTWRAAIGGLCMVSFIGLRMAFGHRPFRSFRDLPPRDRWSLIAAAVANTVLNLSIFIAFERVSIALALLVFYLYPALVAMASVVWFGERLDGIRWGALGTSLIGSVLVVAGAGSLGRIDLFGIGLAFAGALAQAFYVLAARHGFARVPGPQAAATTMLLAALFYAVAALTQTAAVVEEVGFLKSFERFTKERLGNAPQYRFLAKEQAQSNGSKPWSRVAEHLWLTGNR